jgi:hypothetical protein
MSNKEFKAYAKAHGVKLYEIAEALGIRPSEFSVQYMRHELGASEINMLVGLVNAIEEKR